MMKNDNEYYSGIDIGKLIFACLIPILHISANLTGSFNYIIDIIRQYISRLGVPFFFCASGFFLSMYIKKQGLSYVKKYYKRIGLLLIIWLIIYAPLFYITRTNSGFYFVLEMVFKTPGYLWYLTGLFFAVFIFGYIKNRKYIYFIAPILYIIGMLLSESYSWLFNTDKFSLYYRIFMTSRNGLFFGLPFMVVGELSSCISKIKYEKIMLCASIVLLLIEIYFVGIKVEPDADRSFYFALPIALFFIFRFIKNWRPQIETKHFRRISTAIYVMQYGLITICSYFFLHFNIHLNGLGTYLITYAVVAVFPFGFYWVLKDYKIVKILF